MKYRMNTLRHAIAGALALSASAFPLLALAQARIFDIPAMEVGASLSEYGRQAGVQIVAPTGQLAGVSSMPVKGEMDSHAALQRLIAGTGLKVVSDDGRTVVLGLQEAQQPRAASPHAERPRPEAVAPQPQGQVKALDTLIVTGTRMSTRTEGSSLAPIDVVSNETLTRMGTDNVGLALSRLIPSLNFPVAPVATDATDVQRPAQLRGLSPDQVLVLVNGKRWHSAAMVNTGGALGRGSAPVDLDTIPMSSIDHIEVLRDGASAQYGSDAIAGVLNIILKHGAEGGAVEGSAGGYETGGGNQWSGSANVGTGLGADGWLRLGLNRSHQEATDHGGVDRAYPELGVQQHAGNANIGKSNVFYNAEYDFSDTLQLYSFGSYGRRDSTSYELYRNPHSYSAGAPVLDMYPLGFQPRLHMDTIDQQLVFGLRGTTQGDWAWDLSMNEGSNRVSLRTLNTANLALLADTGSSPSEFYDGVVKAGMEAFNLDVSKVLYPAWMSRGLSVAFGAEYLKNDYEVREGEPAAYYVGESGEAGGAQSFNGFQPVSAGHWERHSASAYLNLEATLTERWSASLTGRYSDYSDFGDTTSAALSSRFDVSDKFAVRGSVSTGFHAPSLAQQFYSQVGSAYLSAQSAGPGVEPGIYQSGLLRVNSDVARLLGAEALKPEKSKNYTLGVVVNPTDTLTVTADAYLIDIDDRIVLSGNLYGLNSPALSQYFASQGVTSLNYSNAQFFTNAVDTRTRGVDVVASHQWSFANTGTLESSFSYNYNKNEVTAVAPNPAVLDELGLDLERVSRRDIKGLLANTVPRSKLVLSESYALGGWRVSGNLMRYGSFTAYSNSGYEYDQVFSPQWVLDLSGSYTLGPWSFTLGVDNATDSYPDKVVAANDRSGTLPYSMYSPAGYNGRFYYTRIRYGW